MALRIKVGCVHEFDEDLLKILAIGSEAGYVPAAKSRHLWEEDALVCLSPRVTRIRGPICVGLLAGRETGKVLRGQCFRGCAQQVRADV
jgi:hypothetical protein